ncbi:MgtC/SapB family protein [bacterium]|nr:MgtC/SapB family protein [bacterium]
MITIQDPTLDALARLGIAALLGGFIGFERDKHGRAAGLRTHLLVSMGAAAFMVLSERVAGEAVRAAAEAGNTRFFADPGRIAAQVVTGIGFLGAGVILKSGNHVRGLTTAACLWTAAAVGLACGAGQYVLGAIASGLAMLGLVALKAFERTYAKDSYRILTVTATADVTASDIIALVKRPHLSILNCEIDRDYTAGTAVTRLSVRLYHKGITDKLAHGIIDSLETSPLTIRRVSWSHVS